MSLIDDVKSQFGKKNNALNQLILINVIVFILMAVLNVVFTISGANSLYQFILNQIALPTNLYEFIFKPWTLVTYFFLHEDFFHILGNMITLFYFGNLVSEYLGHRKLISIYVLGGLVAAMFALLIFNTIPYFMNHAHSNGILLGASGAVYAVVVAAATFLPEYSFFLIFIGAVRIKYIAMAFIFISFLGTVQHNAGGNLAHLGGALLGYLFVKYYQNGTDIGKWILVIIDFVGGIFKPKPKMKVTYKNPNYQSSSSKNPSQEEIDQILDKISKSGYESLSKEEKQKLFAASQK